jgi:hypothetical protein
MDEFLQGLVLWGIVIVVILGIIGVAADIDKFKNRK